MMFCKHMLKEKILSFYFMLLKNGNNYNFRLTKDLMAELPFIKEVLIP